MDVTGCERLRDALRGCRLVLLTATDMEAEPLRVALVSPERHLLATKTLYVGELPPPAAGLEPPAPGTEPPATGLEPPAAKPESPVGPCGAEPPAAGRRVVLAVGGCDKANTAHVLTALLQAMDPAPRLVLQVGIAGALPAVGKVPAPVIGDLVLATSEAYSDTGSSSPEGWKAAGELGLPIAQVEGVELGGVFPLDAGLVGTALGIIAMEVGDADAETERLPSVFAGPCITASMTTGIRADAEELARRWDALAESMEGAAAAHVCALHGVPLVELRGISNMVDDRDRGSWQIDRAVAVAGRAALAVATRLEQVIAESTLSRDAGSGRDGGSSRRGRSDSGHDSASHDSGRGGSGRGPDGGSGYGCHGSGRPREDPDAGF